ncbi:MAG TPA: hypothetical protein VLE97_11330 [Gaiellaceae bacterium]|nr:hypothetical protein [Gaiellaceae bacterium]
MADMNKRGPDDDCEDGEGERGERGERGRRGHRGHRGRDGRDGTTGPTGPTGSSTSATGFTGPTGPTGATGGFGSTGPTGPSGEGSQGLVAYGYAAGIETYSFTQGIDVQFDQGGLVFPNAGITPPAPNGTAFTILTTGDYEYDLYFCGHVQANTGNTSVDLGIFVNGASAGAAHTFRSNFNSVNANANDELVCRGEGIIHLVAGDLVTMRVVSPAKGTASSNAVGGDATANRTLSLKKLSA